MEPYHKLGWNSYAPIYTLSIKTTALSAWCEPPVARTGQNPWLRHEWKILPTRIGYYSNTKSSHSFRCEDNNVKFTNVQPHYYRVLQVEPCHQLGWSSQALILSTLALGAMPKQQQQRQHWRDAAGLWALLNWNITTFSGLLAIWLKRKR